MKGWRPLVAAIGCTIVLISRPSMGADPQLEPTEEATGMFGEGSSVVDAQPDDKTGAMSYSFPFALPPARGRIQPKLGLHYNSSTRDREAGYGWGLGLPTIERHPLSGWPEFDASGVPIGEERYEFSGQPLVRICDVPSCPSENYTEGHPNWADGWVYYRLQVEGLFARFYRSSDYASWKVLLKGGEVLEFGAPPPGAEVPVSPA